MIKGATDADDDIFSRINNVKSKLALLGKVLDFFAVLATGKVQPILEAAVHLNDDFRT